MIFPTWELFLYAIIGGAVLGLVLGTTRPHMTGRATIVFTMLYYFLFTGFLNIRRYLVDGDPFDDSALLGFERAFVFGVAATAVVVLFRIGRKRALRMYISDLERQLDDCEGRWNDHDCDDRT